MTSDIVRTLNTKISALLQMGAGPTLAEAISLMHTVCVVKEYHEKLLLDNMDID
jgi:hypothetical protein